MNTRALLTHIHHRPYPLPNGPWLMQQTWQNLLFIHCKVPYEELRRHIPADFELDHFKNDYWISIAPFQMRNIRFRSFPAIPTTQNFLELNFRTYVKYQGRAGIYFFSLDASSTLATLGARLTFLPYYRANMKFEENESSFCFSSKRLWSRRPAHFQVNYQPSGQLVVENESLDRWLVERYCLFQKTVGKNILRIDIHHIPWELQGVEVDLNENSLATWKGMHIPEQQPMVHYVRQLDVLIWPPKFC